MAEKFAVKIGVEYLASLMSRLIITHYKQHRVLLSYWDTILYFWNP